jgi:hypothetical protein
MPVARQAPHGEDDPNHRRSEPRQIRTSTGDPMRPTVPQIVRLLPVLLLVLAVALSAAAPASAQSANRVVNIVMEDQHRSRHETGAFRGDVVVLVYADRKGAEAALELGRRLHVLFHPTAEQAAATEWSKQPVRDLPGWPAGVRMPDVRVIPVACLQEVPKPLQPVVRSRMRTDSPHVPVWLDFDGEMTRLFGAAPDEPNVVVLDANGLPYSVQMGHLDELEFRELAATVDRLRLQARPAMRTAAAPAATLR